LDIEPLDALRQIILIEVSGHDFPRNRYCRPSRGPERSLKSSSQPSVCACPHYVRNSHLIILCGPIAVACAEPPKNPPN
jgi:hypothetical protein